MGSGGKLDIEVVNRVEVSDLIDFIHNAKGISYSEAENILPGSYYEGGTIYIGMEDNWCKEVIDELKRVGLKSVEVYQDY